jgi:ribonuclease HI
MEPIYCDGSGWSETKKRCGWCVVLPGKKPRITQSSIKMTNNECEYQAVIEALSKCKKRVTILTDSRLAVEQVNGNWECKHPLLKSLHKQVIDLKLKKLAYIWWIPRKDNKAGKILDGKL